MSPEFAEALVAAQEQLSVAVKGATNPFFESTYADLSSVIKAIKEPLNSHGIAFLQLLSRDHDGFPCVDTMLLHKAGGSLSTRSPVYCAKQNNPQAFGSGVTYTKRYALQAILGLPAADDDGEGAMDRTQKKKTPQPDKPHFKKEWLNTSNTKEIMQANGFDSERVINDLSNTCTVSADMETKLTKICEAEQEKRGLNG